MSANWSKVKELTQLQKQKDPQRARLSEIAINSVEEGLRHLESVGHPFELVPRGTLVALIEASEEAQTRTLNVAEASQQVAAPALTDDNRFEARATKPNGAAH